MVMNLIGTIFFALLAVVGALLVAMGATDQQLAGGMVIGAVLLVIGVIGIIRTRMAQKKKKARISEIGLDAYKAERKDERRPRERWRPPIMRSTMLSSLDKKAEPRQEAPWRVAL